MKKRGSRACGIFVVLSILSVLLCPAFTYSSDVLTLLLFGREYFNGSGTSFNRTFSVPTLEGTYALNVINGNGAGNNTVSSAIIRVNGTQIVGVSDINGSISQLTRPLTNLVQGNNTLNVEFPQPTAGTCISITITGDYLLNLTITSPVPDAWIFSDRVSVTGTYVSYTGNMSVTVNGVAASASGGGYTATDVPLISGSNILTATILTADSIQRQASVSVNANRPPVANAGQDISVMVGDNVILDGRASYDPEGNPINYLWSFSSRPAGSSSAFFNPTSVMPHFIPDFPGSYVASLTVNDPHSSSAPDTVNVSAAALDVPPTAAAGPDQSVNTGYPVLLDGTGSFDPYGGPLTYSGTIIELPTGSMAVLSDPASPQPIFTPDLDGQYVIRLVVASGQLYSLPDNVEVAASTPNAPPVANSGPDQAVFRNGVIVLDGTESYDPEGAPIGFSWTTVSQPQGSMSQLENPASPNPTMVADREGEYVFRLVVNDSELQSAPDTVVVTAVNAPPVAYAGADINAWVGVPISLDGSGSSDPNGDPLAYSWSVAAAPQGSSATIVNPYTSAPSFTPDVPGQYVIGLVVNDGNAYSSPSFVTVTVGIMVSVPDLFGKPRVTALAAISNAGLSVGAVTDGYSDTVIPGGVSSQEPAAGTTVPQGSAVALVISTGPAPVPLPPDPATVAPPVNPTVATTVLSATEFLYTGANPIQTGVAPGTIELKRAAVVRGRVLALDNTPLSSVTVTVLNHPELGQTLTRADGIFDMAVNGGGLLTVNYQKGGYLPVQRQVNVPWQDYSVLPDVVLIPYDNQVTAIDLASVAPVQVARGNVVTDGDGTRQATLLFTQGTQAEAVFPDGSASPISALNVRATEYTVGPTGPNAMPAQLPPTSGYTYAVDLSVDEAVSAGATDVRFDRPVIQYVDNFLNFPVGGIVPVGYYDRDKGVWIPSQNGKIIMIIGVTGGLADIDTDGDGGVDNAAVLSALGVTDEERAMLRSLYTPGKSLWRVPITHFSPWDCNWPYGPPWDAVSPNQGQPKRHVPTQCPNTMDGSIIECEDQVLGESTAVAGTPFGMNYRSSRVPGYKAALV